LCRKRQLNVSETRSSAVRRCDFDAAYVADHAVVALSTVLAARACKVASRAKDCLVLKGSFPFLPGLGHGIPDRSHDAK
jgi:hypothetical protein